MSSAAITSNLVWGDAPERRRGQRYQVDLVGELRFDGGTVPVRIADLSGFGALIAMSDPPPRGSEAELWISDFGAVAVEVMRTGERLCGVALSNPAADHDRLLDWLLHDVKKKRPDARP